MTLTNPQIRHRPWINQGKYCRGR